MSTILIQKKSESKETLVQQAIKLPMDLEKVEPAFEAIDFAGLSWLILEYGDEIWLESNQSYLYDRACHQMYKSIGIRFAAIINKKGRKIAGGFNSKVTPLEQNEKKLEMLFMEMALDLSMRSEFNDSLGKMSAIVSFRDKTNVITIPHGENFMLVSSEPEIDSLKVIETAYQNLLPCNILEALANWISMILRW